MFGVAGKADVTTKVTARRSLNCGKGRFRRLEGIVGQSGPAKRQMRNECQACERERSVGRSGESGLGCEEQ